MTTPFLPKALSLSVSESRNIVPNIYNHIDLCNVYVLTCQIDSHLYFVLPDFELVVKTLSHVVYEAPGCGFCLTDTQGVEGLKDLKWTPVFPHKDPYAALEKVHLWNKDVYLPLCINENLKT